MTGLRKNRRGQAKGQAKVPKAVEKGEKDASKKRKVEEMSGKPPTVDNPPEDPRIVFTPKSVSGDNKGVGVSMETPVRITDITAVEAGLRASAEASGGGEAAGTGEASSVVESSAIPVVHLEDVPGVQDENTNTNEPKETFSKILSAVFKDPPPPPATSTTPVTTPTKKNLTPTKLRIQLRQSPRGKTKKKSNETSASDSSASSSTSSSTAGKRPTRTPTPPTRTPTPPKSKSKPPVPRPSKRTPTPPKSKSKPPVPRPSTSKSSDADEESIDEDEEIRKQLIEQYPNIGYLEKDRAGRYRWPEWLEGQLIEAWEAAPYIYDVTRDDYMYRGAKKIALEHFAKDLQLPESVIENRMEYLRSQMGRAMKTEKSGSAAPTTKQTRRVREIIAKLGFLKDSIARRCPVSSSLKLPEGSKEGEGDGGGDDNDDMEIHVDLDDVLEEQQILQGAEDLFALADDDLHVVVVTPPQPVTQKGPAIKTHRKKGEPKDDSMLLQEMVRTLKETSRREQQRADRTDTERWLLTLAKHLDALTDDDRENMQLGIKDSLIRGKRGNMSSVDFYNFCKGFQPPTQQRHQQHMIQQHGTQPQASHIQVHESPYAYLSKVLDVAQVTSSNGQSEPVDYSTAKK